MVEWKNLTTVAEVQYGYPFDSSLFSEDENNIPLIRIRDVKPGEPSTYFLGEYPSEYIIHKGDILVGMDGEFNLAKWKSRDGLLNQRVLKLTGKNNQCLNGYLFHYMGPVFKKIELQTAGGSVKHLSAKAINRIKIPIPSLEEQNRIVGILDTFTDSIENLKQQIVQRRKQYEYYRDQLLDLEGKETKLIGDLFEFKNGLNKEKKYFGQGNPIVNYTDVYHNNKLTSSILKGRVTLEDKEIERYRVFRGDVFFTRTSETPEEIGYAAVLIDDIEDCTFSGFLLRARPITNLLLPDYCGYCFSAYKVRKEIIKLSTYTTRALTNGKSLSKIRIPVPPLSEQQRIVSILDTFEASISNLEAQLEQRQKQYEYYRNQLLTFE